MLYRVLRVILIIFIKPIMRVHVNGLENLPENNDYILCSNHSSNWDPIFLAISLPNQIYFMAKKEILEWPIIGRIIKKIGVFAVDRDGRDMASLKYSIKLLKEGKTLGIFPEGTRVKSIDRENMKDGVAFIALKAKADVVPVEIISTFKPFRKTFVNIHQPIKVDKFLDMKTRVAMEKMTDEIFDGIYTSYFDQIEGSNNANNYSWKFWILLWC